MITCQESSTIAGSLQIFNKYQSSSQHLQISPMFTDSLCSILPSLCWEISLKHKSDQNVCVCVCVCVCTRAQLCLTLCEPMDYSPLGSSVHGILQGRLLEWVAIPSSRGSSQPRDQTRVSCVSWTVRWILYHWTTWEAQSKHIWP